MSSLLSVFPQGSTHPLNHLFHPPSKWALQGLWWFLLLHPSSHPNLSP